MLTDPDRSDLNSRSNWAFQSPIYNILPSKSRLHRGEVRFANNNRLQLSRQNLPIFQGKSEPAKEA